MTRSNWHTLRDGDTVTVARHVPVRFDVVAETHLPVARAGRVAHQVRQDMWRALRNLRGFSPVVSVTRNANDMRVQAGGRVAGRHNPAQVQAQIADLLNNPANRARWVAHADAGKGQ